VTWQIDGKNTANARYIANAQQASVRFNTLLSYGKTEPDSGTVRSNLGEGQKYRLLSTLGQTTAMVLDINQNTIGRCVCTQDNFTFWLRKFESVLQ